MGDADVGAEGEVDAEAVAVAVEDGDDGFCAFLEGGETVLEGRDAGLELEGEAGGVWGRGGGRWRGGLGCVRCAGWLGVEEGWGLVGICRRGGRWRAVLSEGAGCR